MENVFNLDMRSVFLISTLYLAVMTIYLFIIWLLNRKEYKGIGYFIIAMIFISTGNFGVGLQDKISSYISIILSNTIFIFGSVLTYISIRLFFKYKTGLLKSLFLFLIPAATLIEQIIFYYFFNYVKIRILWMSIMIIITTSLTLILMIKIRKKSGLPGILILIILSIQLFIFIFRIPFTIIEKIETLLNSGKIHSISVLIGTLGNGAWPTLFALLISEEHRQREKTRSKEKELLLQELYHRTKNNMNIMIALLQWQHNYTVNKNLKKILDDIQNRIYSMALIHKQLYNSKNLTEINLKSYIHDLIDSLKNKYQIKANKIKFILRMNDIHMNIDTALHYGLIINELITNILNHAFPENKTGTIEIELSEKENKIILCIKDNGKGFPPDFDIKNNNKSGLKLVKLLVEKQLNGKMKFISRNGLNCIMQFKKINQLL